MNDPDVVNSRQDFDPDRPLPVGGHALWLPSWNGGEPLSPTATSLTTYRAGGEDDRRHQAIRPFFLFLAHWAPHTLPQATREDYEALSHIDDHRESACAAMI
ncbi:MAG: hypothetical protein IPG64_22950 [Haliea sp.]|nr:hypothetical protein [Haliea sp.]